MVFLSRTGCIWTLNPENGKVPQRTGGEGCARALSTPGLRGRALVWVFEPVGLRGAKFADVYESANMCATTVLNSIEFGCVRVFIAAAPRPEISRHGRAPTPKQILAHRL